MTKPTGPPSRLSHVLIRAEVAKADEGLKDPDNRGRKVFAVAHRKGRTEELTNPEWQPNRPSPICTKVPGLEIATFNEQTVQDSHKHEDAAEIYTVLSGEMHIKVDDETIALKAGDEVVVMPGTCHEVMREGTFIARVHSVNCRGAADKFPC